MRMKALTIMMQERTAREESSIIGLPKVGYSTALTSWFLLGDGSIYQVESCAPFYFLLYVLACTLEWSARDRQELLDLASTYDEEEWNLNRWYVLDTLKERKLHTPLFNSADEAYACVILLQWMRRIKDIFPLREGSESL